MSAVTVCFCQVKNWSHQTVTLYWTIIFGLAVQINIHQFLPSWSCTFICVWNACCCGNKLVSRKIWIFNTHWDTNYKFACSHTNSYSSCKRMTPEGEILQSTRGFNTDKNHWKMLMDFVNFPFACISTQLPFWFSGLFFF